MTENTFSNVDAAGPTGHLDVLGSIPAEYRQSVLEQCGRRRVKRNDVVWHQGDPANYVGFLVQGKAMSTYASPNGKTGVTGFWARGDLLGAADLGVATIRQLTVRCLEDSNILMLPIPKFFEISRRFPEVSQAVIVALSVRLRWVAHLALTLETQNAFGRICTILLTLSETFPQEHPEGTLIDLSMTNESLAAIVGVARQSANITLNDLKRRSLIRMDGRRIVVRDREGLQAIAYQADGIDNLPSPNEP